MSQDMAYYKKSFLQMVVVMLLAFIFFLFVTKYGDDTWSNYEQGYRVAAGLIMFVAAGAVVIGPSTMFYSMSGKHDRQNLLLIPASNFEKYLVRYMNWIVMLPIWAGAILLADVLQYIIHIVLGYEYYQFVVARTFELTNYMVESIAHAPNYLVPSLVIVGLWLHSVYTLGATFFRSRKYSFVYSTFAWIAVTILLSWLFPNWTLSEEQLPEACLIGNAINIVWTIVNFWLSYVDLCRTQVIGKFVNL
jgi:hypothetical protein